MWWRTFLWFLLCLTVDFTLFLSFILLLILFLAFVFSPSTLILPHSSLSDMKLKDVSVLLAYCTVCMMNESCPPRERQGAAVYTAEYRLMFSYGERGKCRKDRRLSLRMEGRNEGRTADDRGNRGVKLLSLYNNAHRKCHNT